MTDADPDTGRFEDCNELSSGTPKDTKTCYGELWLPELIRISLAIPKPAADRDETEESEIQRDCGAELMLTRMD